MTERIDVVAEHVRSRRPAAMACRSGPSRIGGTHLDSLLEGDDIIDIQEPNVSEVLDISSESLRQRARRLEIEAATGCGPDQRMRYHGRITRGKPPRRDIDDQDLAFAIDELQRGRAELACAYDLDAPPIQKQGAISRSLDRVRFALGFALDLLDRHEALL